MNTVVATSTQAQIDPAEESSSGVSWAAVIAGAFVAAALWFSLSVLGAGMGLSAVSPWPSARVTAERVAPIAIIWIMIVQALACSLGGYLAGRLRTKWTTLHTHEVFFRDTAHGFLAWAVGLVIAVLFLSSVGLSLAKDAATVAADGKNDYYVDTLFRAEHPTADANDPTIRAEAKAIFAKALTGPSITPKDRSYLAEMVAARTGLDRSMAEARVNETEAAARQALDTARKATAHSLYWLFAALLLGAFCGSFAATIGGRQRDNVVYVGMKPTGRI